jgi:hypothetical protein
MHPLSRSTLGTVAIGLLVVFLAMGISGIFAPVATPIARLGSETPAEVGTAAPSASVLAPASAATAAMVHPSTTPTITVLYDFTCDVSGAGFCSPQYWTNGATVPLLINTTGFAADPNSVDNITVTGTLTNTTSHTVVASFTILPWTGWEALNSVGPNADATVDFVISNASLGLSGTAFSAANLGSFSMTSVATINTTAGTPTNYTGTVTSPTFTMLTTGSVTVVNDLTSFAPGTDPLTGAYYESAPFDLQFNVSLAGLPSSHGSVHTSLDYLVTVGFYGAATYATWSLPSVTNPADGTTTVTFPVDEANLSCGSAAQCYSAINQRAFVIQLTASWNITTGTDYNNASMFVGMNDTSQIVLDPSVGSIGGLEIVTGPTAGVIYSALTTIPSYTTLPLSLSLNVTSFNVASGTAVSGWVTIRDQLTGGVFATITLNGTFTAASVSNTVGYVSFNLTDAALGCGSSNCYNIPQDPYAVTANFQFLWSVVPVTASASGNTFFITVPVSATILPTSTGTVGIGNVTFSAIVTGQYIAAVVITVYSPTGSGVALFTSSLINATTGFGKTATWVANSPGVYPVVVNITTNYASVTNVSEKLTVVASYGPVYFNQTTYHNATIFPGVDGAVAGTLLLLVGLIVGIIIALLVGWMMWGGRDTAAPAQPWQSKTVSATPNTCAVCGKSFDTPEALSAHATSEHGAE